MKLRRAGPGDEAKLSLIGQASFLETFANDHDWAEVGPALATTHSPEFYADKLADPANALWLVEEAVGCPIGYALLCPPEVPGHAAGDIELKRIYVLSKWHGRGVGSQLYAAAEAEARTRSAMRLLLSVYIENHSAQAFYRARGHVEIGRYVFEGYATAEDFIYAKSLIGSELTA